MKNKNLLDNLDLFPIITEGEDDNIMDLDTLLQTGVGNDYTPINTPPQNPPQETEEEKAARLAKEEKEKQKQQQTTEEEDETSVLELLQSYSNEDESQLSEEDKETKKLLLDHFKGEKFDTDGNILDKDGNIISKFEDVEKFINEEPTFDKDGNQVDDKGNIIKTKAEVAFEDSAISGVIADLGYKLEDADGNPILYEDTLEGWTKLAKDIGKIEASKYQQAFFNSHPVLSEVAKHLLSGNDLSTFNTPIDYSKIDKTKLSENDKLDLIRNSFITSGLDKDRTEDMVNMIKTTNSIDKELDKAINALETYDKESKKQREEAYQAAVEKQQQETIKYWTSVKSEIDKGTLGGLDIPKTDQEAFYEYISKPVDSDGNSQETLDLQKMGLGDDLKARYLMFKKYDVKDLVTKEVNKNKVRSIRERIQKSTKSKSNVSKRNQNKSGNNDISLDTLLES